MSAPRWEWRAFGTAFPSVSRVVQDGPHRHKSSSETYLLSATPDINVKIRDHQIDVKRLVACDRGLELWTPVLKAPLPLEPEPLVALCALWGVALTPVPVQKERDLAERWGCQIEIAALTVNGRPITTVAVESEDPAQVRLALDTLDLSTTPNTNYVHALRQLLGVAASATHTHAQEGALP